MNSENKKILTVSFIVAGVLTAFVVGRLLEYLAASFSVVAKIYEVNVVSHGLPILLGAVVFFYLQFNKKSLSYFDEVVSEVRKIVWPSQKDTTALTIVVCILVGISSIVLWGYDFVTSGLLAFILK